MSKRNTIGQSLRSLKSRNDFTYLTLSNAFDASNNNCNSGSKRHSLHAVELSQRSGKPCANCVDLFPPPAMGARLPFLVKPAMRTRWMAGNAPHNVICAPIYWSCVKSLCNMAEFIRF